MQSSDEYDGDKTYLTLDFSQDNLLNNAFLNKKDEQVFQKKEETN